MLLDRFSWWNFINNKEFRKTCPGIGDKCQFIDRYRNSEEIEKYIAEIDSIVTMRDGLNYGFKLKPNLLRFVYILESNHHAKAVLRRSTDILASYSRSSNLVVPYAKWVPYDKGLTRKTQGKF